MFFRLSEWQLALILFAVVFGVTVCGLLLGAYLRERGETLRESFGVLQGTLLGLVGLILAFGSPSISTGRREASPACRRHR